MNDLHYQYKWYKEAIGYQIYPKTFFDSNNDGIGDLKGIVEKLDYIKDLGIDFIWICPFYQSPMDDNGYDVSDYFDVAKQFGTMQDVELLINEAKKRDLKIILDLVLNHTSDEHEWFLDIKNNQNSKYLDYYIIESSNNDQEPNNWASFFGGSCWSKLRDNKYYMHIFSKKMPDLNWKNKKLRNELYQIATWWLEKGIDGFRIDAISHIARKDLKLQSNLNSDDKYQKDWSMFSNLEDVHVYLKEFNKEVLSKYESLSIGEVGGNATSIDALKYSGYNENELDMVFTFEHLNITNIDSDDFNGKLEMNIKKFKEVIKKWQIEMIYKSWYPLYYNNHDTNRLMSNYGDINYHYESATSLATMMYLMWGTVLIYQGEEIGMTNYPFKSIDEFNDVQGINQYHNSLNKEDFFKKLIHTTRDNVRTVMQWNNSKNAGFSSDTNILVNPNYIDINVEKQIKDNNSILNYYKSILSLKKSNKTFIYGDITFIDQKDDKYISYIREDSNNKYLVVANLSKNIIEYDDDFEYEDIILSNYSKDKITKKQLLPYQSYVTKII